MNQNTIFSFSSSFFFYLLSTVTLCSSLNPKFQACEPTACGNVPNITYPFYIKGRQEPYCGYPGFALSCSNSAFPILNLSETQYIVHEIFYNNQSIRVSDAALSISNTTACLPRAYNLTVDGSRFGVAPNQKDLFLVFGCNLESLPEGFTEYRIGCSAENGTDSVLGMTEEGEDLSFASKNCEGGVVKTKVEDDKGRINGEVLRRGFVLNWTAADCSLCAMTGGKCGFDSATYSFSCYCQDRDHARKCDPG